MNKANLKSYAPKARLDFIKAVTERANVLGISAAGVVPAEVRGDVALIDGREWPAKVAGQRDDLIARIKRHGFEQTMDEVAYTWFNRFAALRYMEIHDYLGHGWRVLSSRDGGLPEILRHASEVTLPGLNPDRAREMQLAGNQDNELYKLLLVAQCNELSRVMPFLFERIDDETELLLPENLLRTDSIVAKLVEQVPEEDWQEIEVIGWLYQFYISEKKDQVIGKVVKSEDIPAATQLFTPNWIVQYLVQNSVGRLWLMANPTSTLARQWPYYIQPAEQTAEVQAQLDGLIQTRVREDGETLNPETITVLDPACGSGHILVVAYDILKAIYLERGYQPRSIPRLILEKNLFGLEIDDRAAQLGAFALMMKARADDRRLFNEPPLLNVISLQDSNGLDLDEISRSLAAFGLDRGQLKLLLNTFERAKTLGSLTEMPDALGVTQLRSVTQVAEVALREADMYGQQAAKELLPLLRQSLVLGMRFDAVVTNPPYMTSDYFPSQLKDFVESSLKIKRTDLYALLLRRGINFQKPSGRLSYITRDSWMFLPTYEAQRVSILAEAGIESLIHLGTGAFDTIAGQVVQTAAFTLIAGHRKGLKGTYLRLVDVPADEKAAAVVQRINVSVVSQESFERLPAMPIVYWISGAWWECFENNKAIGEIAQLREGIHTGKNELFMRLWWEPSFVRFSCNETSSASIDANGARWIPYNKGGAFRKWYGNNDYVIRYDEASRSEMSRLKGHVRPSQDLYFKEGGTWTDVGSGSFGVRYYPAGFLFDGKGMAIVGENIYQLIAMMNSKPFQAMANLLMPTLNYKCGTTRKVPSAESVDIVEASRIGAMAVELAKVDWSDFETSWEFRAPRLLTNRHQTSLEASWKRFEADLAHAIEQQRINEFENNRLFIRAYGLAGELSPEVEDDQLTLTRADPVRDCQRLVSYAVGCMMGRYSLDEPGLIFANAGNIGFDSSRYARSFPADSDGIVPVTDEPWFAEDAPSRMREFLLAVWGSVRLEENMGWLATRLGSKSGETPDEAIRRYFADRFFKDHLQIYKKRPIYWLFSSGKHGGFQALVYLHRYNEGTLARMRSEYVVPLVAKVVSRLDMLIQDLAAASSASARTKLQKQIEVLRKKQLELLAYDEKLRHYADMRITLDLDDGVKVNYAKFGDLVAESKAITGGSDE